MSSGLSISYASFDAGECGMVNKLLKFLNTLSVSSGFLDSNCCNCSSKKALCESGCSKFIVESFSSIGTVPLT